MRHSAPTFPYPGSPGFGALSPEDQRWVTLVRPWYNQAATQLSPTLSLEHPLVEEFERNPHIHLPKFVQFYTDNHRVFETILMYLTKDKVTGDTPEERRKAWQQKIKRLSGKGRKAAE